MISDVISALVGAGVGAVIAGVISFCQQRFARRTAADDEVDRQRLELVREIIRYKLNQDKLVEPLNEVFILFGDDSDTLRLVRKLLDTESGDARTAVLSELLNRLCRIVGVPGEVTQQDIDRGFMVAS